METRLIETRPPNQDEKERGAEVVFVREDENGYLHNILGCKVYESWEQWGASHDVLCDNVETIENWRNKIY
jgi:hypothetical protein